ncbi:MAG: hypothetical protein H0W88_10110 [Parachlamydiaceae bacterium]|nr:hypothetical protein [Parachlamydiaceae bacterium]
MEDYISFEYRYLIPKDRFQEPSPINQIEKQIANASKLDKDDTKISNEKDKIFTGFDQLDLKDLQKLHGRLTVKSKELIKEKQGFWKMVGRLFGATEERQEKPLKFYEDMRSNVEERIINKMLQPLEYTADMLLEDKQEEIETNIDALQHEISSNNDEIDKLVFKSRNTNEEIQLSYLKGYVACLEVALSKINTYIKENPITLENVNNFNEPIRKIIEETESMISKLKISIASESNVVEKHKITPLTPKDFGIGKKDTASILVDIKNWKSRLKKGLDKELYKEIMKDIKIIYKLNQKLLEKDVNSLQIRGKIKDLNDNIKKLISTHEKRNELEEMMKVFKLLLFELNESLITEPTVE